MQFRSEPGTLYTRRLRGSDPDLSQKHLGLLSSAGNFSISYRRALRWFNSCYSEHLAAELSF